jgi:protein-arginine kinase activator protein McsA
MNFENFFKGFFSDSNQPNFNYVVYTLHVPSKGDLFDAETLEALNEKLDKAVEAKDYEMAARLQRKIRQREQVEDEIPKLIEKAVAEENYEEAARLQKLLKK